MKTCKICNVEKSDDNFYRYKHPNGVFYFHSYCKDCTIKKNKIWEKNNPEKKTAHIIWRKYKITMDEYNAIKEKQLFVCAICKETKPLVLDHSHATGKIRGMLCNDCNHGIGKFRHNTEVLKSAIKYLDSTR